MSCLSLVHVRPLAKNFERESPKLLAQSEFKTLAED
jgi:hypothetical protein